MIMAAIIAACVAGCGGKEKSGQEVVPTGWRAFECPAGVEANATFDDALEANRLGMFKKSSCWHVHYYNKNKLLPSEFEGRLDEVFIEPGKSPNEFSLADCKTVERRNLCVSKHTKKDLDE